VTLQKGPILRVNWLDYQHSPSSNMFRNLIPRLAGSFHVVAPDYPGFGQSSMPDHQSFAYTFQNLTNVVEKLIERVGLGEFSLYVMDYGAPVGYPARVAASQSGASAHRTER
jgi:pimeloyl-ACP methyl ester carboxylesterase